MLRALLFILFGSLLGHHVFANDISEKSKKVFEKWLLSQNQGDFSAYQSLYAKKFFGVKRAGNRRYQFNRKNWLKDRKRMFRHPMKVRAENVEFKTLANTVQIRFVQHWSSRRFSDKGPKKLLLVQGKDGLHIAQEVMLRSDVINDMQDHLSKFRYILDGQYIIVAQVDQLPKHGPPSDFKISGIEAQAMQASIEEKDLPGDVLRWKSRKITVDDGCHAKVKKFFLLALVVPHFGTVQSWQGINTDHGPLDEHSILQEKFKIASKYIVGKLEDCNGMLATTASNHRIYVSERVKNKRLRQQAIRAFTQQKDVKQQLPGPWWREFLKVEIFRHRESKRVFVSVMADNGGICGEPTGSAWHVFESSHGKLKPLYSGRAQGVVAAIDINGDGILEYITRGNGFGIVASLVDPAAGETELMTYAYNDCPC